MKDGGYYIRSLACANLVSLTAFMVGKDVESYVGFFNAHQQIMAHRSLSSEKYIPFTLLEIEVLKNVRWVMQSRDQSKNVGTLREELEGAILGGRGIRETMEGEAAISVTFYDVDINHEVCHDPSMGSYTMTDPGNKARKILTAEVGLIIKNRNIRMHLGFPASSYWPLTPSPYVAVDFSSGVVCRHGQEKYISFPAFGYATPTHAACDMGYLLPDARFPDGATKRWEQI